jgi:DNA-binding NarL/FixJ family response regulator
MRTTIALADDHELVRKSIASLLRTQTDFEVVAECASGRELLEAVAQHRPNVALLDISMPELNGIETAKRLREISPGTRVIALSNYTDGAYVRGILQAGGVGYVVKSGAAFDLVHAVRTANRNKMHFSPEVSAIASNLLKAGTNGASLETNFDDQLSPRERETLQLIAEGHSSKEIASTMGISEATVKCHRKHIKEKLAISDTPGLTRYALKIGLVRLSILLILSVAHIQTLTEIVERKTEVHAGLSCIQSV